MIFIPTYLYVKKHTITGLLYFGKTIKNPYHYNGSGKRWLSHLKKHGKQHVKTLWVQLFTNEKELVETAINFSTYHDIVNSNFWANLAIENGTNGGPRKNSINFFKEFNTLPKYIEARQKRSRKISATKTGKPFRENPVMINNIVYQSITAASRAHFVSDAAVHYWIKKGKAFRI